VKWLFFFEEDIVPENDLLMQEVYTLERGLRVEFLGIQLDELWSFVGNKKISNGYGLP
jgi:hypothetical protein